MAVLLFTIRECQIGQMLRSLDIVVLLNVRVTGPEPVEQIRNAKMLHFNYRRANNCS